MSTNPLSAWRANPFFVLELETTASRVEIERAAQRILALLTIDAAGSQSYATPFGPEIRNADDVRLALSELRDPVRRIVHELWACVELPSDIGQGHEVPAAWVEAPKALGWAKKCL
jgi:hypothetical protein